MWRKADYTCDPRLFHVKQRMILFLGLLKLWWVLFRRLTNQSQRNKDAPLEKRLGDSNFTIFDSNSHALRNGNWFMLETSGVKIECFT